MSGLKKYWIGLSEHSAFCKDDKTMFVVFPASQRDSSSLPVMVKYIEADNLEAARRDLHAFVDSRIDHELHMVKLETMLQEKNDALSAALEGSVEIPDSQIDSLSIGAPVNHKKKLAPKDNLLRMEDILGPDKAV